MISSACPPIEYLARWRMQLAARLLDQGVSIAEAAASVGYDSEATFNRVFKRFAGAPPGASRRARPKYEALRMDTLGASNRSGSSSLLPPSTRLEHGAFPP